MCFCIQCPQSILFCFFCLWMNEVWRRSIELVSMSVFISSVLNPCCSISFVSKQSAGKSLSYIHLDLEQRPDGNFTWAWISKKTDTASALPIDHANLSTETGCLWWLADSLSAWRWCEFYPRGWCWHFCQVLNVWWVWIINPKPQTPDNFLIDNSSQNIMTSSFFKPSQFSYLSSFINQKLISYSICPK